jgi:6-phosphogluconolactonase (cycloisomerase 2 family)
MRAYLGSRTTRERHARGQGISVFEVDHDGGLHLLYVHTGLVNPSYLAINKQHNRLYCVHGDGHDISCFAINTDSHLHLLKQLDCEGKNPVHLALSHDESHLLVSNHLEGGLVLIPLSSEGEPEAVSQHLHFPGTPGPHRTEQTCSKPHFNPFDPSGQWVLVPDKGLDKLFSVRYQQGHLSLAHELRTRQAAGPRNCAFHPLGQWLYLVNELDSTVVFCHFDVQSGQVFGQQIISTVPDHFFGHNRAASIQVDTAGRYVYVSNRGHDSIAVFAIDASSGRLSLCQIEPCHGRTPRFFCLHPQGHFLYVLNEDSDTIEIFSVQSQSGQLLHQKQAAVCQSATCMVFA